MWSAEPLEIVDAELVHHRDEAPAADLVAGDQRKQVAVHLHRLAHVGAHDASSVSLSCRRARRCISGM